TLTEAELGCLTSHYLVCRQHLNSHMHLHVVEDDVMFSSIMKDAISAIISSRLIERYDILFLDTIIAPFKQNLSVWKCKAMYDKLVTRDVHGKLVKIDLDSELVDYVAAATSYLLNCGSIQKLLLF